MLDSGGELTAEPLPQSSLGTSDNRNTLGEPYPWHAHDPNGLKADTTQAPVPSQELPVDAEWPDMKTDFIIRQRVHEPILSQDVLQTSLSSWVCQLYQSLQISRQFGQRFSTMLHASLNLGVLTPIDGRV